MTGLVANQREWFWLKLGRHAWLAYIVAAAPMALLAMIWAIIATLLIGGGFKDNADAAWYETWLPVAAAFLFAASWMIALLASQLFDRPRWRCFPMLTNALGATLMVTLIWMILRAKGVDGYVVGYGIFLLLLLVLSMRGAHACTKLSGESE